MKHIIAALLALFAIVAHGQTVTPGNPCGVPIPPGVPTYYTDVTPTRGYACAPGPVGDGTMPTVRANMAGVTVWWYCKAAGKWTPNWAAATADALSAGNLLADAKAMLNSQFPLAVLNGALARNITLPLSDPSLTQVWCPWQAEMFNATPPADPVWRVAVNPLSTTTPPTRASFAVVNGVRSFSSAGPVTVGSACDCSALSITEGSTTFCSVAPSRVSVCTKP